MAQNPADEEAKKKLIKLNLIGIIMSYKIQTYNLLILLMNIGFYLYQPLNMIKKFILKG
jgi:hypothetical protein